MRRLFQLGYNGVASQGLAPCPPAFQTSAATVRAWRPWPPISSGGGSEATSVASPRRCSAGSDPARRVGPIKPDSSCGVGRCRTHWLQVYSPRPPPGFNAVTPAGFEPAPYAVKERDPSDRPRGRDLQGARTPNLRRERAVQLPVVLADHNRPCRTDRARFLCFWRPTAIYTFQPQRTVEASRSLPPATLTYFENATSAVTGRRSSSEL